MRTPSTYLLLLAFLAGSSKNGKETITSTTKEARLSFSAGPPAIVYKTPKDYSDKVVVTLSLTRVLSSPFPLPKVLPKEAAGKTKRTSQRVPARQPGNK